MTSDDSQRYARHIALPQIGADGQQKLRQSHALIIGLGGLGTSAALYLANSGLGHLTLNDFDRVDDTNLPRQILYTQDDIGQLKADVAAEREERPRAASTSITRRGVFLTTK